MKLKIDITPKVDILEFFSLKRDILESATQRSIVRQRGLEFDHFRQYQPDDDARLIDWRASARANDTLVRVYSEDIAINILLLLDVGETMIYGTGKKAKIEYAMELAVNLAYGALRFGDRVGLMMFNSGLADYVPYGTGLHHFSRIVGEIQELKNIGGKKNLRFALNSTMELYRDTHLIMIISDFIGLGDYLSDLHSVYNSVDLVCLVVRDKTDNTLEGPGFYFHLQEPATEDDAYVKLDRIRSAYKAANQKSIKSLSEFLSAGGHDLWVFDTEDDIEKKLNQYTQMRNSVLR